MHCYDIAQPKCLMLMGETNLVKGSVGGGEDGVVGVGLLQGRDEVCCLQGCVQCREMLVLLQSLGETLSSGH